jgi:hypothetical protein
MRWTTRGVATGTAEMPAGTAGSGSKVRPCPADASLIRDSVSGPVYRRAGRKPSTPACRRISASGGATCSASIHRESARSGSRSAWRPARGCPAGRTTATLVWLIPVAVTGASSVSGSPGAVSPSVSAISNSPRATPNATSARVPVRTLASRRGMRQRSSARAAASPGTAPVSVAAAPASGVQPTMRVVAGVLVIRVTSARAASRRSRMGPACSRSRLPASVGSTGRRLSSCVFRSFSRAAICCDTAACV